ncbi:MAG TPA: hypothetical protein VMH28_03485 [Candidatus Acidoferrales bacterium]|nr:hypothetical protein [Candidatus Acidoferrales bacterium]
MRGRRRTLASVALLLALVAGFYWKITISGQWTWLESSDIALQVRPWLDFQAREFHAGRIPLWDPYEWGGHSLIGQVQPGLASPLNWILFAMPLREGHIPTGTLQWYWVLIHWLAAVFAYALCRDLACGHAGSILGGAIFALAGFVGHTDWPQVLIAAAWIPLVFLFFARVVRGRMPGSSAALSGAALGLAFLGTHPVVPTFTALLTGFLWLAYVARDWRRARYLAIFVSVWLAIAAVQILPAIEYGRQALRWAGAPEPLHWNERVPFSEHVRYSLGWPSVAGIVMPGISLHANPHLGFVAAGLALFAVWRLRRHRYTRWFAAVALGGLLLSLGGAFPPYWLLWRFVPLVEKAREPAFAIVLCHAGVAVLAALAVASLKRGWAPWLALALFLVEAVYNAPRLARFDRPGSYTAMIESQKDVAAFLKSQPGWFRVDFDENDVPYNFGDLYGIEQFGGLVSSMPERTQRLLGQADTPRLFGIQYRVARTPADPAQQEVFRSASGLRVYRDWRFGEPLRALRDRPCAGEDRFRSMERFPNRTTIEAGISCPALVVAGDAFYAGWRAFADGVRVPVQEVSAVRAVRVPAGSHRVEFVYRPASLYWGCGADLAGIVLILVMCLRDLRATGTK